MKYIRTKDGHIYETTGQGKNHPRYYNIANANLEIDALGIVMQANTIEELCDEFVAIPLYDCCGVNAGKHYLVKKEEVNDFKHSVEIKTSELFGAIWTDKGLIYVAKMNDKGELELL